MGETGDNARKKAGGKLRTVISGGVKSRKELDAKTGVCAGGATTPERILRDAAVCRLLYQSMWNYVLQRGGKQSQHVEKGLAFCTAKNFNNIRLPQNQVLFMAGA